MTPGHFEQALAALPSWWERAQFTARGQAVIARLQALLPIPTRQELAEVCDMSQILHEDLLALTPLEVLILTTGTGCCSMPSSGSQRVSHGSYAPFVVGVFYGAAHMPAAAHFSPSTSATFAAPPSGSALTF